MFEPEIYLNMARNTEFFKPYELEVLLEMLVEIRDNPNTTYIFNELMADADTPLGFAIYGRTPMTSSSWDLYWIVIDNNKRGRGLGKKLLENVENYIKLRNPGCIVRAETSYKPQYMSTVQFYRNRGYTEVGRIPDFYSEGDNLITFYKKLE